MEMLNTHKDERWVREGRGGGKGEEVVETTAGDRRCCVNSSKGTTKPEVNMTASGKVTFEKWPCHNSIVI
jgi:hypothetical protein